MVQSRAPTTFPSDGIANRLLISLPKASLKRLQPALELRVTARGNVIERVDRPVNRALLLCELRYCSRSSRP